MTSSTTCNGCHADTNPSLSKAALEARTSLFGERLFARIFTLAQEAYSYKTGTPAQQAMYTVYNDANLKAWLVNMFETIPAANPLATPAELKKLQEEALLEVLPSRTNLAPKLETVLAQQFALAAATFNNFMYYDGSKHGIFEEGDAHGGSWAHNSTFARQMMYDAIEDVGGDLTGLVRP
jgi:hypothetical protein